MLRPGQGHSHLHCGLAWRVQLWFEVALPGTLLSWDSVQLLPLPPAGGGHTPEYLGNQAAPSLCALSHVS